MWCRQVKAASPNTRVSPNSSNNSNNNIHNANLLRAPNNNRFPMTTTSWCSSWLRRVVASRLQLSKSSSHLANSNKRPIANSQPPHAPAPNPPKNNKTQTCPPFSPSTTISISSICLSRTRFNRSKETPARWAGIHTNPSRPCWPISWWRVSCKTNLHNRSIRSPSKRSSSSRGICRSAIRRTRVPKPVTWTPRIHLVRTWGIALKICRIGAFRVCTSINAKINRRRIKQALRLLMRWFKDCKV